jgi:uncharacterized membrane protein YhaH (DUF805 family)
LQTTWVVREIDKITAMGYFVIVVSVFISAEFLIPDFLDEKVLKAFQDDTITGDGHQNATTTAANADGANATMETIRTDSIGTAVGAISQPRTVIILFSLIALGVVSYMVYKRLRELRLKAWTAFTFLLGLEAIKIEKSTFDKSLQEIEQYLDKGDWTMARYWMERVMNEYSDLVVKGGKEDYREFGIY